MTNKTHNKRLKLWLSVLIGVILISGGSISFAQADTSVLSDDGLLTLQGIVRKVSVENNSFLVKISKGKRLQIVFSSQTETIGLPSPAILNKGERVKVWYNHTGKENRAVKVELLPVLGC